MALYRCIGNGGGVTPTDITPSDVSPASMSADGVYKATAAGYAIESSPTDITPSNSSPVSISSGTVYRASGNGKAIETLSSFVPSPNSYFTVHTNDIIRNAGNDDAIFCKTTPLTPSNDSPQYMMGNHIYKFADDAPITGYAIESFQSKTPAPIGVAFDAGFVKMSSAGYASTSPHGYTTYTNTASSGTSARVSSYTISNKSGSLLLVILFDARNTAQTSTKMDGATVSGGTMTKLCNLTSSNIQVAGTVYVLNVTSDTCTITLPNDGYVQMFEAS